MRYIKFSPDGSLLIGSNAFYEIYVWNTSTENLVGVIEFGQWIRDFDIAPDNDKIVVTGLMLMTIQALAPASSFSA